jgi:hypothetical protein
MIQSSSEMNERYNILPLPSRAVVCLKIISHELSYDPIGQVAFHKDNFLTKQMPFIQYLSL